MAFLNYIIGGGEAPSPHGALQSSSFSLKYKQNIERKMEFRSEV
jgi:hypothetical protein